MYRLNLYSFVIIYQHYQINFCENYRDPFFFCVFVEGDGWEVSLAGFCNHGNYHYPDQFSTSPVPCSCLALSHQPTFHSSNSNSQLPNNSLSYSFQVFFNNCSLVINRIPAQNCSDCLGFTQLVTSLRASLGCCETHFNNQNSVEIISRSI